MSVLDWISAVLLALGVFVALTSAVGVLRMPDFFTRIHPAGKNDSLAQLLVLGALLLQATSWQVAVKLLMISAFLLVTTPSSTYAIARAALVDGRQPWTGDPPPEEASP
ncbi:MAG: monovalent cation/H(+) antiporter subunit G [Planctomycetes bacterium]|nr:monovalent cation/H(+) antiporter subunit G [Planctomycetota bacterium]